MHTLSLMYISWRAPSPKVMLISARQQAKTREISVTHIGQDTKSASSSWRSTVLCREHVGCPTRGCCLKLFSGELYTGRYYTPKYGGLDPQDALPAQQIAWRYIHSNNMRADRTQQQAKGAEREAADGDCPVSGECLTRLCSLRRSKLSHALSKAVHKKNGRVGTRTAWHPSWICSAYC